EAHRLAERRPLPRGRGLPRRGDHNDPFRRLRPGANHVRPPQVRGRGRGGGGVVAHGPAAGDGVQGQAGGDRL
ncbi:MAG: hypothetical protein AVDCRST_MAG80-699, partial [uncultured Rubrobacteraceae bacterium]